MNRTIRHYMENRLFEWAMTTGLLGTGILSAIYPMAIERGLFKYMLLLMPPVCLIVLFLSFGVLRIIALVTNGRWPVWGSRLRVLGAAGSALLLSQMAASLITASPEVNNAPSLSIPIYISLVLGELYAANRAARSYA